MSKYKYADKSNRCSQDEDFIEHRKMLKEMLDTSDKGFSEWELNRFEEWYRNFFTYTDKMKAIIQETYKKVG